MTNPVSPNGALITNQIKRYDKTEDGVPRLKVFLNWIYDIVSTHGLPRDTYSVGFKDIASGTIILTSQKNHHSWTIRDISKTGNPTLIFNSTVGRESSLIVQERQSWPNPYWIFEPEVDKDDETKQIPIYLPGSYAGFRYWRPVEFLKQSEKLIPGYDEEQHLVGVGKWKTMAQQSLAKVPETVDQVVIRLLKDACSDFKQRVDAVTEAEEFKKKLAADLAAGKTAEESEYISELLADSNRPSDNRCMTYKSFDQFSTPSRDKRLIDSIILARAYFSYGMKRYGVRAFAPSNLVIYKSMFPLIDRSAREEAEADQNNVRSNFCNLNIPEVGFLNLARYKRRVFSNQFTSNPNDSYTGRFGYPKTNKDLAETCPAYDLTKKSYDLNQIEEDMAKEVLTSSVAH
jgi:hypothetical protein